MLNVQLPTSNIERKAGMENGKWNMENGIWNMEYGIWNMEYGKTSR
jgi:hypothetical protein